MAAALLFAVNGEKHEVVDPDPTVTLSDYLRGKGCTGVKIGCGEGGCGACTVVVANWDASASKPSYRSVNACLVPLCSCDGLSVTTTEGLRQCCGGSFHPLQERLADANGSQCGYCSPGMVMSMFGKLSAHPGPNCPDEAQIESALDGNLCRCTGYRAILSAFKSFAGTPKDAVAGEQYAPFPDFLKARSVAPAPGPFAGSGKEWFAPNSIADLFTTLEANVGRPGVAVSMLAGHTARGIYKKDHLVDVLVDVSKVPELTTVDCTAEGMRFGAAVTLNNFIRTMEAQLTAGKEDPTRAALPTLLDHAQRISGHGVRNWGTLGGNLVMTKAQGFQSDLATILTGVGATVTLMKNKAETEDMPLDAFYSAQYQLTPTTVLKSVFVPYLEAGEIFRSFKVAVRPQNSHAILNAAFRVKAAGGSVASARLVFGALGSRGDAPGPSDPEALGGGTSGGPLRAPKTEEALAGKELSKATLEGALNALQTESWWPEDEYERHLAITYLYKLFRVLGGPGDDEPQLRVSQTTARPASKGTQKVDWAAPEAAPIGKPDAKLNSKLQTAGDIRYTADIAEPRDTLYAAYVSMPRAGALLVEVDTEAASKMTGVVCFVDASDIPGENASESMMQGSKVTRLLVAKGEVAQYAGQPCLVVLADSIRHAELAAKVVVLKTEMTKEKPLLTLEDCEEAEAKFNPPPRSGDAEAGLPKVMELANTFERGDAEKAMKEAPRRLTGEIFCNSQKHFYMEPLAALAIPGEDGTLQIISGNQVPSWSHSSFQRATGLPKHKLLVTIPSIGGGFGGKLFRSHHVGCTAAVAAMKVKRAVKLVLNRNIDMVMSGGRFAITTKYEVGFDDAGKIQAVTCKNYADGGIGDACGSFTAMVVNQNMEQIYGIPNVKNQAWNLLTAKTACTAVRGPGEPQSTFIMETILEHVAAELGKSTHDVREVNIFTDLSAREKCAADPISKDIEQYSAQIAVSEPDTYKNYPALGIWEMLKTNADYAGKEKAVEEFNAAHTWTKRGIAMTPVRYGVSVRAQQVFVCLYDDGTCLITCDGTEMGQGLWTKVIQYAAYHLSQIVPGSKVPEEDIRCGPAGTDKIAVGSFTGGSTTSEGCCEAVRVAIEKLAKDMEPTKKDMLEKGELTYKSLVKAASAKIEMQASGACEKGGLNYHCFGACVSTVEVDVLTGETTILSSDMLYDCGRPLNPTVDLGQAEGAFVMGLGFFLRENLVASNESGQLFTDGTWEYKIPCVQDIPLEFNVEFFPRAFSEGGIMSSKASGEPPIVLACSAFCAVRQAVAAARKTFGRTGHFRLDAPATPRDIALAIGASPGSML
mmetsp:Transcript_42768/g.110585  ORF Transcript_42768/g.110585 Transcript_42768/m.110585 type:complete len:1324 (+) Transcript_42768:67-4038(+)